jgi:hypothetical protein
VTNRAKKVCYFYIKAKKVQFSPQLFIVPESYVMIMPKADLLHEMMRAARSERNYKTGKSRRFDLGVNGF